MTSLSSASNTIPTLAIVIPAYNEELTIADTIRDFYSIVPEAYLYIVNNNSSDKTAALAEQTLTELQAKGGVMHEARQGKATAVRKAFSSIEADIYVMVDADCTYPASDLPALLQPVLQGDADMVVGNRHAEGLYANENKRRFHDWGNQTVKRLINILFHGNLQDILSGYRVFSRKFVKNYPILSQGFAIETEVTIHALDKGYRIVEIPTQYKDRPVGSFSKLNTIKDGIRIIRLIFDIFMQYRPLVFFTIIAALFAITGLITGSVPIVEFCRTAYISHFPLAILASALMILSLVSLITGFILQGIAQARRFNYALQLLHWEDRNS